MLNQIDYFIDTR